MNKIDSAINSKIIYLYRHGETNWNVEDKITGQLENIDTYFTDIGYKQINELTKKLKENQIEVIYCSDLKRTVETAIMANSELNLPIFYSKEIRGLNMGKYQGMRLKDFINQDEVKACFSNYALSLDGGESINQLNERITNFIKKICSETEYKKIAIISHSAAISNLKAYVSGDKYVSLNQCTLLYANGKLSVLDYEYNYEKYSNSKK